MSEEVTIIRPEKKYNYRFCICTLVTDWREYGLMKDSFELSGFTDNCIYYVADNSKGNVFDAYNAIRRFLNDSPAEFTIIVHQDVRCIDNIRRLDEAIDKMNTKDPMWALLGNAGGNGYKNFIFHLDNNGKINKTPGLPMKATSLDENFLLVRSGCGITVSSDIKGFHFYGTDLCVVADFLGYNCYVVEFMVKHLSSGNLADMHAKEPGFIKSYGRKLRPRFVQTSCTKFYLGNSESENRYYNSPFLFFWVKAFQRLKNIGKKLS